MNNTGKLLITVLLCAMGIAPSVQAVAYTWTGGPGGGGDAWRQANNWSPASPQGGPRSGDVAVFGMNGTALSIGINFNDGRGLTNPVAAILLTNGPGRDLFNSAPNSTGTLRLDGWQSLLLANHSDASVLTLRDGASSVMRVELAATGNIHVSGASAGIVLASRVGGTHGFTKTGAGWLRLSASNPLAGAVTVSGGRLELASASGGSLRQASGLRVESGASAVLAAPRQLGTGTALDLAGGTLRGADGATLVEEHAGTLTLSASSTIDLRASAIRFAGSSAIVWGTGAMLTITNWHGAPGGGLFFGTGGLTSTQLAQIYFADLGIQGAQLVGPDGELMPIPEAPVAAGAAVLAAFIVWRELRRLWPRGSCVPPRCGASASPRGKNRNADG